MATLTQSNSLTAVNAVATIIVPEIAPAGHIIEGEFLDQAYATGDLVNKELKMSLQSKLYGGYIPQIKTVSVTLLPGSPSAKFFADWYQAEQAQKSTIECKTLVIALPAIKSVVTYTNGFLTKAKIMPDVKKVLQEVTYEMSFGTVTIVAV